MKGAEGKVTHKEPGRAITVMDGLSHDFSVIILEDCSASRKKEFHQGCLNLYRDFALYPLLRIMTLDEFIKEVSS